MWLLLKGCEAILDAFKAQGVPVSFCAEIETFAGEVWMACALKDKHKWVVRAPTADKAFEELRVQCEGAL